MNTITFLALYSFCYIVSQNISAQMTFQRTIGGTVPDQAYSTIQTSDGGYILAGTTASFGAGNYDFYIVKLDGSGLLQWSKTVGGTGYDYAYSVIQTSDGGYAVAGYTDSFGAGSFDMYIVKLDGSGALQWSKTIGGTSTDAAYSIKQTTDGGYTLAGVTYSFGGGANMYIVKLDGGGTVQWSKSIGGTNYDDANSVILTTDGGYGLAGSTNSFGAGVFDFFIVKLDASGSLQWSKSIGGINDDYGYSTVQTPDNGYILAGYTRSFGAGLTDAYILKIDASGTLMWSRTVGGTNDDFTRWSVIQTADSGFAVPGYTYSFGGGGANMYIVKLNAAGILLWSKTVGGPNSDLANSIIQTADRGFVVSGYTVSFGTGYADMFIVKLDSNGNTCGNSSTAASLTSTGGNGTTQTPVVTSVSSTVTSPSPAAGTGGTLATTCFVGIQPTSNEVPNDYRLYQNYPNPFNPATKLKFEIPNSSKTEIRIYDVLGKYVVTLVNEELKPGTYEIEWDASNFPSGVYFYKLVASDYNDVKKMVLIK